MLFVFYIHYNRSAKFSYWKNGAKDNHDMLSYYVLHLYREDSKLHFDFDSVHLRLAFRVLIRSDWFYYDVISRKFTMLISFLHKYKIFKLIDYMDFITIKLCNLDYVSFKVIRVLNYIFIQMLQFSNSLIKWKDLIIKTLIK